VAADHQSLDSRWVSIESCTVREMQARSEKVELLALSGVNVVYSNVILGIKGVSLSVPSGSMVALLGANGAGKTTTLKSISNLISVERGKVTRGTIRYEGEEIQGIQPERLVQCGIVQVLEGRRCFLNLTVEENLAVAANGARGREKLIGGVDEIYSFFPNLAAYRKKDAAVLSGGEQQMLAIGRALLAQPRLLLLDEPSMGLAPQVVSQIFLILNRLNKSLGLTILVAEQNARVALRYADYGYVLGNGNVLVGGTADELSQSDDIKRSYFGIVEDASSGETSHLNRRSGIDWMS
jgi:branched-chain amino acid transport system ATP-binding protein